MHNKSRRKKNYKIAYKSYIIITGQNERDSKVHINDLKRYRDSASSKKNYAGSSSESHDSEFIKTTVCRKLMSIDVNHMLKDS